MKKNAVLQSTFAGDVSSSVIVLQSMPLFAVHKKTASTAVIIHIVLQAQLQLERS
nr:MAG TPA: hypothetical protein [Inoviridae sp.]